MATQATEMPVAAPALAAEHAVKWPKRTRARLANGLQVVLAEAHSIPKFHGELFFRAGEALMADRSTGLAEMTATVVRTGTAKRTLSRRSDMSPRWAAIGSRPRRRSSGTARSAR